MILFLVGYSWSLVWRSKHASASRKTSAIDSWIANVFELRSSMHHVITTDVAEGVFQFLALVCFRGRTNNQPMIVIL
jgi:hypothetical protein